MCCGQSVVMDGKVYYGGGETEADEPENSYCYFIQCYDPSQDKWTILPQLKLGVRYFGLGQLDGRLVAVGGEMRSKSSGKFERSKCVQRLDGNSWRSDKIPSMSLALIHPAVISHSSTLIVAGGEFFNKVTGSVEIFRLGEGRWCKFLINSLPKANACCGLSIVSSGSDKHYALGGNNDQGNLNQALYISTKDLHTTIVVAPLEKWIAVLSSALLSSWYRWEKLMIHLLLGKSCQIRQHIPQLHPF